MVVGDRFGNLTVMELLPKQRARFMCTCGSSKEIYRYSVTSGRTISCGCVGTAASSKRMSDRWASIKHHGMSLSPEYKAWQGAIDRCRNPKNKDYGAYGGNGIVVYEPWVESFEKFFFHVGPRPSVRHSLDRIDNGRGYTPGNVRWATCVEQNRNRRSNRLITYNGRTQCLTAWADELGIKKKTLHMRLLTMSVEKALTQPLQKQNHTGS